MRQEGPGESFPAPEESAAAGKTESGDGRGDGWIQQPSATARRNGVELSSASERAHPMPRSHRELGVAILAGGDPVEVGRQLLHESEDRGAATRLRSLEIFAGWAFGKPDAEGHRKPPRIIWDIPGPPYEAGDPEEEKLEGGRE